MLHNYTLQTSEERGVACCCILKNVLAKEQIVLHHHIKLQPKVKTVTEVYIRQQ